MKTLILIVAILFCVKSLSAQKFVDTSNRWYEEVCCINTGSTICELNEYYFETSVIIDNIQYYQLINSSNTQGSNKNWREDQGKVYSKYGSDPEYLIYDFNVDLNDTVKLGSVSNPLELVVVGVDSIALLNGELRKRIKVGLSGFLSQTDYWIEGIGSVSSPMSSEQIYIASACESKLECFTMNSIQEYGDGSCELVSTKNPIIEIDRIEVFPNPFTSEINILKTSDHKIKSIHLLDLMGRKIRELSPFEISNLQELINGCYLISVKYEDGNLETVRIVKT